MKQYVLSILGVDGESFATLQTNHKDWAREFLKTADHEGSAIEMGIVEEGKVDRALGTPEEIYKELG